MNFTSTFNFSTIDEDFEGCIHVEGVYSEGTPAKTSGAPEDCYPEEYDELGDYEATNYDTGEPFDVSALCAEDLKDFEHLILENLTPTTHDEHDEN